MLDVGDSCQTPRVSGEPLDGNVSKRLSVCLRCCCMCFRDFPQNVNTGAVEKKCSDFKRLHSKRGGGGGGSVAGSFLCLDTRVTVIKHV